MNSKLIHQSIIMGSLLTCVSASSIVQADQVILDDLIVDGSTCVGFDCVNGESFGFDTLRLKENNLRIKFEDTSTTSSFPSNDWQLTANDTSNGGANKFSIDDISGGKTPFTVEAGAPSHSLYVDDGGRLGLGTSTPVVDIHSLSGNTPTLRLEQDGSSGFTAQTWDVAGNEANFFIRDATNGSTLPFRVFPGAPSNALTIEATTGDIGMGTTSPEDDLHISGSDPARLKLTNTSITNNTTEDKDWIINSNGTLRISAGTDAAELTLNADGQLGIGTASIQDDLHVTDDGPARLRLTNSTKVASATEDPDWIFNSNGDLRITAGTDAAELTLSANGNLTVTGGYFVNATQLNVPDYVFEPAYELKSIEEQARYMWDNKHLPSVEAAPSIAANGQIDIVSQQLGMLEELEKAHIYISDLHNRIKTIEEEKTQAISMFETRLQKLEEKTN